MIPKIIHYCWFGGNALPKNYSKFIEEWKELNPEYEIMRWDESNCPMDSFYMQNAYKHQNWANMSNLMRLMALANYGGIYLDTDMKVLKPLDSLLEHECFLGFEEDGSNGSMLVVNNAILGAVKGHFLLQQLIDTLLNKFSGVEEAHLSSPRLVTEVLQEHYGLKDYGFQKLQDITLYPIETFYPIKYYESYRLKSLNLADYPDAYTIHFWGRSWWTHETMINVIDGKDEYIFSLKEEVKRLNAHVLEIQKNNEQSSPDLNTISDKLNHILNLYDSFEQRLHEVRNSQTSNETILKEFSSSLPAQIESRFSLIQPEFQGLKEQFHLFHTEQNKSFESFKNYFSSVDQRFDSINGTHEQFSKKLENIETQFQLNNKNIEENRSILFNDLKEYNNQQYAETNQKLTEIKEDRTILTDQLNTIKESLISQSIKHYEDYCKKTSDQFASLNETISKNNNATQLTMNNHEHAIFEANQLIKTNQLSTQAVANSLKDSQEEYALFHEKIYSSLSDWNLKNEYNQQDLRNEFNEKIIQLQENLTGFATTIDSQKKEIAEYQD
mgnify:CR=1 FL=1